VCALVSVILCDFALSSLIFTVPFYHAVVHEVTCACARACACVCDSKIFGE
jgi:hypothetical protein